MATKLVIPIVDLKKPPKFEFPKQCVNCGKPPVDKIGMSFVTTQATGAKQKLLELWLPYCAACASRERKMFLFALGPFLAGFLLVGVAVFIPVWFFGPTGSFRQTRFFDVVLAAFCGLIAGLAGGFVAEFISKFLLAPFLGSSFARRPLLVVELLSDVSYALGVSGKFDRPKQTLALTFERDDLAREFAELNQQV